MLKGWKYVPARAFRCLIGSLAPLGSFSFSLRKGLTRDQELFSAMLQALNVARDNKAMVVARDGTIISINALASQLCGRSQEELLGKYAVAELFEEPPPVDHSQAPIRRWETRLKTASGQSTPIEVVHQQLHTRRQDLDVYAIRDLRHLREAAEERQRQITTLQQREEELRTHNMRFDAALNNMSQGLAMFDHERRLIVCNKRYAAVYGLPPQLAQPGVDQKTILKHRIAIGAYPGEDPTRYLEERVAVAGAGQRKASELRLRDGRVVYVLHQPMDDGGWLSTHEDVTERYNLHAQLKQQNELLDAALNNMAQGLAMFDAQQRLVLCNHRYAEIYGFTPDQIRPGTTLRQIIEHRISNGLHSDKSADEIVTSMLRRRDGLDFGQFYSRLSDGRCIAITAQPMAHGGTVTTHQDVTEQQNLNARLEQQHQLLKEREQELRTQNMRFHTALSNMSHGLCMVDASERLVVCNDRYARMYGLSPHCVRSGTPISEILAQRVANGFYGGADPEVYMRELLAFAKSNRHGTKIQTLNDGRVIAISSQPMAEGGWVGIHEDITERQKLRDQLDAALNNMAQGLAMFDRERRLVLCNARFAAMYGLTPDQVKPGTTLRQIVEYRIAKGDVIGKTADELLDSLFRRLNGKDAGQYSTRLSNGRCIAVSVQPMADGGRVTTHHDITEQQLAEAKIAHMALHDALTGLPNRVLLHERMERALKRAKRGEIVATHLLDLDHFKNVNDTLGHPAGDELLKKVVERLSGLVRETDTIARMGGDEFAILQVAIAHPSDATALAQRIIEVVSEPYDIDGHQVIIGTSVGIAVGPLDGDDPHQLIRNADLALYGAKEEGRARHRFFEPEMDRQMQARRAMECDLRQALANGEFELHYQPFVNLQSSQIIGFEALVRWRHPTRGMVAPGEFMPLAEDIGFIVPLGEWVLRSACAAAVKWPDDWKVAVNVSPAQFRSAGLVQVVVGALAASGLSPGRLELEITESVLLEDKEATLSILYQLRQLGVGVAMDDFGTGYSSLSYLQSFPFDRIKIDRSFVNDINDSATSLNIVRAVAALAEGLSMASTAEGVETQGQLETVKSEGCTEMQGYYFSPPLPLHQIEEQFLPGRKARQADAADAA